MRAERRDPEVIFDVASTAGCSSSSSRTSVIGPRTASASSSRSGSPASARLVRSNAQANEVAIETLELAHEGFELE